MPLLDQEILCETMWWLFSAAPIFHMLVTQTHDKGHSYISLVSHSLCFLSNPLNLSVLRGRCRFRTTTWPVSWSASVGRSIGWRWSKCATAIKRCWTMPRTSWRSVARSRTCCVTSLWRLPLLCPPRSNTWALLRWTSTPDASHFVKICYSGCRPLLFAG